MDPHLCPSQELIFKSTFIWNWGPQTGREPSKWFLRIVIGSGPTKVWLSIQYQTYKYSKIDFLISTFTSIQEDKGNCTEFIVTCKEFPIVTEDSSSYKITLKALNSGGDMIGNKWGWLYLWYVVRQSKLSYNSYLNTSKNSKE